MMSLLNFPPEIILTVLRKINLIKRHNLAMTHSKLAPLCFDRTLDRKPRRIITLNELHQLFVHSRTEEEREICFKAEVFDKLYIHNFKEVVHLFMDPNKNEIFANNPKILQYFKGKIVLDGENEHFCEEFYRIFLLLLARVEGNLLIAFVNVNYFENLNQEHFRNIISRRCKRGEDSYSICYNCDTDNNYFQILGFQFIFSYVYDSNHEFHCIRLSRKKTCVKETKLVIEMINQEYRLSPSIPALEKFLPLLERCQLVTQNLEGDLFYELCENCEAELYFMNNDDIIFMSMMQPFWSNCDDCKDQNFPRNFPGIFPPGRF